MTCITKNGKCSTEIQVRILMLLVYTILNILDYEIKIVVS